MTESEAKKTNFSEKAEKSEHKITNTMGYKIKRLSQMITRLAQQELRDTGLTPFHVLVLRCLAEEDNVPSSQIGERLNEVGATMTGVLDRMESRKLITRTRDKKDRRIWRIRLTSEGVKVNNSLPASLKITDRLASAIDVEKRKIFDEVLDQLIETASDMHET